MVKNGEITLEKIFDSLPDAIVVFDKDLFILNLNDPAETMFMTSRTKVIGRPSREIIPEEIEELVIKAMREERTLFGDVMSPVFKGGAKFSIQPIAGPIFSSAGVPIGAVLQIKDYQAIKFLAEKNLQKSQTSALPELIWGLAHELKNPLSGIRGAAQMLSVEDDSINTSDCATIIMKETDRLVSLLNSLKNLEPFSVEKFDKVDVHEFIREIEYLESRSAGNEHIEFVLNFDVTLPPIHADRDSLKQVFLNLIQNSVHAVNGKGKVEITTRWVSDYKLNGKNSISIEIKDNGNGIPSKLLSKIYEPFYSTKSNGTGLGLFLAYQIISKHEGAIIVESEPGIGTTFKVYMPVFENTK